MLWIKFVNFYRSLIGKKLIVKTGNADIQLRYMSEPWKTYSGKVLKHNEVTKKVLNPGSFRVFTANEIIYIQELKMETFKINELLLSNCIYISEEYIDLETRKRYYSEYYRV